MTSQAGHHGGVSQLYPKQGFVKIKTAGEDVLNRLRTLFRSICFCKELVFLFSMAFMLTHAQGEEQTGICKLMDPAIIWDLNSVVNFEMKGLCPSSSTKQLPTQHMNVCIPHVHITTKVHSPDPLGRLSPSKANVKVVIMVLAIIGGIGLAGRVLYERRPAFTEADINRGLASEPAVPRRSDRTFEIPPNILGIAD